MPTIALTITLASCFAAQLADEGAVDLDRVDRELADVVERRVPGAEIIEQYAHTERTQLRQRV